MGVFSVLKSVDYNASLHPAFKSTTLPSLDLRASPSIPSLSVFRVLMRKIMALLRKFQVSKHLPGTVLVRTQLLPLSSSQ